MGVASPGTIPLTRIRGRRPGEVPWCAVHPPRSGTWLRHWYTNNLPIPLLVVAHETSKMGLRVNCGNHDLPKGSISKPAGSRGSASLYFLAVIVLQVRHAVVGHVSGIVARHMLVGERARLASSGRAG